MAWSRVTLRQCESGIETGGDGVRGCVCGDMKKEDVGIAQGALMNKEKKNGMIVVISSDCEIKITEMIFLMPMLVVLIIMILVNLILGIMMM